MAGTEVPDELPESWIEEAEREANGPVPATLAEPRLPASGSDEGVRAVVEEVRQTVFPLHDLPA
jgi:hypothetical protein